MARPGAGRGGGGGGGEGPETSGYGGGANFCTYWGGRGGREGDPEAMNLVIRATPEEPGFGEEESARPQKRPGGVSKHWSSRISPEPVSNRISPTTTTPTTQLAATCVSDQQLPVLDRIRVVSIVVCLDFKRPTGNWCDYTAAI
jgi:hypothetical protein